MTDWRPFAPLDGASADSAPAGPPAAPKNYAAEAAIKAGDFRFRRFLAERHGLTPPLTKERATQRLRSVLGVQSRAELNVAGSVAAERWNALRRDFDDWLRATEPQSREWRGSTSEDSRRRV